MRIYLFIFVTFVSFVQVVAPKPNIVWFLTDDQDQMLGGSFPNLPSGTPMPKTKRLMADKGIMAKNFFIHTPICCPSRSELLSGRYYHNIKQTKGGCMHVNESKVNNATFAKYLSENAGYSVGMFGKYLNVVPKYVPTGFDAWLANGGGDYIAPAFKTYNIDGLPNGTWKGSVHNYTTSVVGNLSIHWIRKVVKQGKPFLAYIAPKAAHEPFNPAPWYADHWDHTWPAHEPEPENWNCSASSRADHHGVIATERLITKQASPVITGIFKNRWRTLMSVDDAIEGVINVCEELGIMDNTYFFYSSDHGFQLGEFNILMDKRHAYDWDTRIHLLVRGPGIDAGSTFDAPATQVDIAPTFLGLAGLDKPDTMDGHSFLPLIINTADHRVSESTRQHLQSLGDVNIYKANWRDNVFIEYYYNADNTKCVGGCTPGNYPQKDSWCADLTPGANSNCWGPGCKTDCYPTESKANNFIAVRNMADSSFGNTLYVEFQTGFQQDEDIDFRNINFYEYYDVDKDPWQMNNIYNATDVSILSALHKKLHQWFRCSGNDCP